MSRLQKTFQLSKTKTTKSIPKAIDMINILYDEEFVALINNLSGIIKEFYKTKSLLFSNMKQLITNSNLNEIKTTFETIEKSYTEFYFDAKTIFKKMKLIRNDNLEKLQSTEVTQPSNQSNSRFNTTGPFEVMPSSIAKKDISATVLKSKYEQMKSENILLKKKIDVFQSKAISDRSNSQLHSLSKDNSIQFNKSNELSEFAATVQRFMNIVNKLYPQSTIIDPSIIELSNNLSLIDKSLKHSYDKEKNELTKLCVRYMSNFNSTSGKASASLLISTPSSKKSFGMSNITSPTPTKTQTQTNPDSPHDLRGIIKKMKQDLENQTNQVSLLFKENEQLKNDFNHLNNVHILEITKNKGLTEQLLKNESEVTIINKERIIANDKYIKLYEENEQLALTINNQSNQLKKVTLLTNHNTTLTEENINLKSEIERLNQLMEVFQLNKKDNDSFEKAKAKKTENQFILLNRKNIDLALKVTAVSKEKKIIQQTLTDKELEIKNLNFNINDISDQIQKYMNEVELLKINLKDEQDKNSTLKKENEKINIKMKELIGNFNHKTKDRESRENIEKINKNLIIDVTQKEQELKNLYEIIQIKDNEIKVLKETTINLNEKHYEEMNIEKNKTNNNIYQIQQLNNKEKESLELVIKSLQNTLEEIKVKNTFEMNNWHNEMTSIIHTNELLMKENKELKNKQEDVNFQEKDNNEELIKNNKEFENIIKDLKKEVLMQNEIIDKTKNDFVYKDNCIKEMKNTITSLNISITQYQIDQEKYQNAQNMHTLETELQKMKELYHNQVSSINVLTKDNEKLTKQSLRLTDTINNENKEINTIILSKDKEINDMKNKIKYLLEENSIIIHDYESKLTNQLNELNKIKQVKEIEIKDNNSELKVIKEKFSKLTEDLSIKDEDLTIQKEINEINQHNLIKQNELISQLNDEINKIKIQLIHKDECLNKKEEFILIIQNEKENMKQMFKSKEEQLTIIISQSQQEAHSFKDNEAHQNHLISIKDEEINRLKVLQDDILVQLATIQKDIDQREKKHNDTIIEYKNYLHINEEQIIKLNSMISSANEAKAIIDKNILESNLINQKALQTKDKEIEKLILMLNNDNIMKEQLIESSNGKKKELDHLKASILNKDNEIIAIKEESSKTLQDLRKQHESEMNSIINGKTESINQLKRSLIQKDNLLVIFESQLKNKEEQINQDKNTMLELKNSINLLKETIKNKTNEISSLEDSYHLNEKQRNEINNRLQSNEDIINQHIEIIKTKEKECDILIQQLKDKDNELSILVYTIKTSNEQIQSLRQNIIDHENHIEELKHQKKDNEHALIQQKEELETKEKEIQSSLVIIQKLEESLLDCRQKCESQTNIIIELTNLLNESKKEVDNQKTIIINHEQAHHNNHLLINQSIEDITLLKESHEKDKAIFIDNINKISKEKENLNKELLQTKNEMNTLEFQLNELSQKSSNLLLEKTNIEKDKENQMEFFIIENKKLLQLNEQNHHLIKEFKQQIEEFEKDKLEMINQLSIQSNNIQRLDNEAEVSESEITRLTNQIIEDSSEILKFKTEITQLNEQKKTSYGQLMEKCVQIENIKKANDLLEKELLLLKDQSKEKTDLINNLNSQNDSNARLIIQLNNEENHYKEQIKCFTDQSKYDTVIIKDLNNQIEIMKSQSEILINQANVDSSMIIDLKTEVEALQNKAKADSHSIKDLNDNINNLNKHFELMNNTSKDEIDRYTKQINEYINDITFIKKISQTDNDTIKNLQKEIEINHKQINDLQADIIIYTKETEQFKKQQIITNNELKSAKNDIFTHIKENDNQKERIIDYIDQIESLKTNNQKNEKTIKDLFNQLKVNEQRIQELDNIIIQNESSANEKSKELQDQLKKVEKDNKVLLKELKYTNNQIDEHNEQIKELTEINKEYDNQSLANKELEKKIKELNKEITANHKSNNELTDQIKKSDIENSKQKEMIKQLTHDIANYCKDIENDTEVITELKNQIGKEASLNKELNEKIKQLQNETYSTNNKADNYQKEIQLAITLLSAKLSINFDENGKAYSLIEIINNNLKESIPDDNNDIKSSVESYTSDTYILLAKVSISHGFTWYLLKSKVSSIITSQTNKDSLDQYKWVNSDLIQVEDFNEPTETFENNKAQYQEELQNMQQYQDQLIDQLAKRESDYRKLNLQVAKIINKQKTDDISQEKKLYQTIEQLKEENLKLQHEIQEYKLSYTNNNNNHITNKILGVSFINELNNTSNFMDDSNVEDLLSEITPKRSLTNKMLPHQQIKLLFEKLLSEILITVSIRSTIAAILKHIQFSNEDINQLFSRFRCGVISLQAGNGKMPSNFSKN